MNLDDLGLDNISGDICLVLEEEGDTSLAGSQAGSVAGSQARTGDWELLERFDTQIELLDFLYQYSFKMVVTHGNQTSKCPLHIIHLISIAITSHETTEMYKHFYR